MISVTDGTENLLKCAQCSKFIYESKPRHLCLDCKEYYICAECKPNVKHEHELIHEKAHPQNIKREIRSGDSVSSVLCNAFKLWAKRPCLGYREIDSSGELKREFKWLNYDEVFERMKNFGFGLRQFVDLKDFVGIFGRNSIDWYVANFSCFVNNIIGPVIPYNIGVDGGSYIVNHTKMKGLICDDTTIENALLISKDTPSLSFLVFIPNSVLTKAIIQEKYGHLIKSGLNIYSFSEIERLGKKNNRFMLVGNTKPDDVATLIYTSGSTGVPKGVVVTEKYARKWLNTDITYGSYGIALRWSNAERESDLRAVVCGLRTAIYSRNVDLLFEDIQIVRPSSVAATPIFWNKIYAEFKANVNELVQRGHSEIELNYEDFAEEFNKRANAFGGYNTSKFVAEKLVYKANKLGLNTIILRPGMISSSSLTGYCNEDDFDNRLLRGIIMSKKAPFFTEAKLEMTPVDFTAKIIVAAGSKCPELNGKIFNIYSPYRLNFDEWITTIEELTEYSFEKYPFHEWKGSVLPILDKENPIQQLIEPYFAKREVFPQRDLNFDASNTDQLIVQNQWRYPKIDAQIIEKHVRFMLKRE